MVKGGDSSVTPEKVINVLEKPRSRTLASSGNIDWEKTSSADSDDNWKPKEESVQSPSAWDPEEFDEQTGTMATWKESNEPDRVQDIPSPAVDDESEAANGRSNGDGSDDIDSVGGSPSPVKKGKKGKKKDKAPSSVRRSDSTDGDEDIDDDGTNGEAWKKSGESNGVSAKQRKRDSSQDTEEDDDIDDDKLISRGADDKPSKSSRSRRGKSGSHEEEEVDQGSFHKVVKDFDKVRSNSRSRSSRNSKSSSGRARRKMKSKELDSSDHSVDSSGADEFGEEEHEAMLKDEDSAPGSGGRRSWRERRVASRMARENGDGGDDSDPLRAPGSAGRRPPTSRRSQIKRASSERWTRAVEDNGSSDADAISRRARNTLNEASAELSRSAHGIRRFHSGGVGRMAGSLDRGSYHGARTPSDTRRRRAVRTPDSAESGGSFSEDYEYDMNLSGRSARTLDSIEDLEDFEHIDFQTPGMIDIDDEIYELMQRANPEHTAQLNRRVHRKREAVDYDQNMPMMTRQALMTRTASTMVQRQYVDGANVDRRRLMLRSDSSMSMASNDDLSCSNHGVRPPRRRPPPRTRSSGMAARNRHGGEVPGFLQQPPRQSDPDRRGVFRTKSSTTSSHSFKQHPNKPNRVASISRSRGGDASDPNSLRATVHGEPSRGVRRHHSTAATLQRANKASTPTRPERRKPRRAPTKSPKQGDSPELVSDDEGDFKKKKQSATKEADDSDVESDDGSSAPRKPMRRVPKPVEVKVPPPPKKLPKTKRDFTYKGNRKVLHSLVYGTKMDIDMKDLFKKVQKGETPKDPITYLLMEAP